MIYRYSTIFRNVQHSNVEGKVKLLSRHKARYTNKIILLIVLEDLESNNHQKYKTSPY